MNRLVIRKAFRPRLKNILWTLAWLLLSMWLSNAVGTLVVTDFDYLGFPIPFRFGSLWTDTSFYWVNLIGDVLIWYVLVSWVLWRREHSHN